MQPNTIGLALHDNPVGQLAWIAEKYLDCKQCPVGQPSGALREANINKNTRVRPTGRKTPLSFNKQRDYPLRVAVLSDPEFPLVGLYLRAESDGVPSCIYQGSNGGTYASQPVQVQCGILAKAGCQKSRQFG